MPQLKDEEALNNSVKFRLHQVRHPGPGIICACAPARDHTQKRRDAGAPKERYRWYW